MFHKFQGKRIKRKQAVAVALLFNTFLWYYLGRLTITKIGSAFSDSSFESLLLTLAYSSSIIASAIAGSVLSKRFPRSRFFNVWLILGVAASLYSAIPLSFSLLATLISACVLGTSLGLGMPLCLAYFSESISIENRGKIGGLTLFGTFFSTPFIFMGISGLDLLSNALFLAVWRAWCLPLLFLAAKKEVPSEPDVKKVPSFTSVLRNRTFSLYFLAWLMFAFVNNFEAVAVNLTIGQFRFFIKIIEPAVAGFSTLVAGAISDWIGRKRVLIFGFVSLGIAYATIGLLPQMWFSWLFYFIIDGAAIGSLWILFTIVLWGDISRDGSEKYYAIGEAPFFLTEIFSLLLAPSLALIPEGSTFSLASFFLFLAVLPLLFAPETLPEKRIKDRELKMYVEKAMKVKEKYA
jgi:MFS family permease